MRVLLCLLLLFSLPGHAADPPTPPATAADQPPGDLSTTAIVERLDTVSNRLIEINEYLRKPAPDLAGITVALPTKANEAKAALGTAPPTGSGQGDMVEMAAAAQKLRDLDRIFTRWRVRLQEEITRLDPWQTELRTDADFLRETTRGSGSTGTGSGAGGIDHMPDALHSRLRSMADSLAATQAPLRKRMDAVVAADVRVSTLQSALREFESQLDSARLGRQEKPLVATAPPLWKLPRDFSLPGGTARQAVALLWSGMKDFVQNSTREATAFGLIFAVLLVAMARLRRSITDRGATATDILLVRYPFAVTLLIWSLVGPLLTLPSLPVGIALLRGLVVIVVLWRILPVLVGAAELAPLRMLLALTILLLLQVTLLDGGWYARILMLLLGMITLLVFRWLARAVRSRDPAPAGHSQVFRRSIGLLAAVAPVVIAVGLIAEILGAGVLAQQTIFGIVLITVVLCIWLASDASLCSVLDAWVAGPGARWLRSVRHWPHAVQTWGHRVIRLLLVAAFVSLLPTVLPVLEPVWLDIGAWLTTPVSVGSVAVSVGHLFWFAISIVLALGVSRFIRFILDEDVLPRMTLATGAASAASRLIYYALVIGGILFSLAVAGVELSKLTLVISALGVGIGFGLQSIVNNFVSGLMLAFERPVRDGDWITLDGSGGQTTGRVTMIGLRATRLRTADGAEVIVPNANLVTSEVINWTLTDRARRIEIAVGVDYTSDPDEVHALLREAIRDLPGVAAHPEPVTAFQGFGASSLDFKLLLWTDDIDDRLDVENAARARVLDGLRKANINLPFPQLDLWVRDRGPAPSGSGS